VAAEVLGAAQECGVAAGRNNSRARAADQLQLGQALARRQRAAPERREMQDRKYATA
jgi:hypothetical protein